jgi:serine/threonine-protein kinase HSL1, negative regulator of Swe1 kinase
MSESFITYVMHEIIKAIAACHEKNICHRDLKLENLLIDKLEKKIKLIDFGLAEKIDPDRGSKGYFGTLEYLAPEVETKRGAYNEKCDMWSLGVIMYAMLTNKFPFTNKKLETFKIRDMIQEGKYDTDSKNSAHKYLIFRY